MATKTDTGFRLRRGLLALGFACGVLGIGPARAYATEDFYRGKTISLILGSAPGGGYDNYARLLTVHMGRHIPGQPTIIVQHMPGAGGLRAANHLYNAAPKDGSVISLLSAATLFAGLLGNAEARFETPKFSWLGNIDEIIGTCAIWHTSGFKHFDELLTKPSTFGSVGVGSAGYQLTVALQNLLGAKITLVKGYAGGNDVNLALQRGEVNGNCGVSLAALKSVYEKDFRAGRLQPIIQLSINKHPDLAGVAHIYDYAKSDEDRGIFDIIFGRYVLGRPTLAPPGLPAERVAALRAAFTATMADPELLADAAKMKLDVSPSSGAEVETLIVRFFSYPQSVVDKAVAATQ